MVFKKDNKTKSQFKKGDLSWNKGKIELQKAWNKGLTKEIDERVRKISDKKKGKKFSEEHRKNLSLSHLGKTSNMKGKHHSKKTKLKLRIFNLGKTSGMKGKKHTEETKNKIRLKLLGKKLSEEHIKNLSKANSGVNNGMYNKHHSKETKEKIRIKLTENAKINPESGMKGKHHSKITKEKIGKRNKGKFVSEETRRKIGIASKENWKNIPNFGMKGKHQSEEAREKYKNWRKTFVLPKKDTSIEVKIQNFLEQLKIEYFKHKYMNIEHGYQCDIFIPSKNLVIECDGDYWHKYPTGREIDHVRTKELIEKGFKVLRLWEHEIKEISLNKFKEKINVK